MHTTKSKVLAIAILLITLGIQSNTGSVVDQNIAIHVVGDDNFPLFYNVDRCIPVIPKSKFGRIYAIETNGTCVNIYSKENCVGQFVRLQTSKALNNVSMEAHRWEDDILIANESMIVCSIGPCLEKCDPRNWAGMRKDLSTNVTIYNWKNYTVMHVFGKEYTFKISGTQCVTIPLVRPATVWSSIKISGSATTDCVELHDDATCGGNSVQLRPGYPNLHNFRWWGFRGWENFAGFAKSISLCGYSCPAVIDNFSTTTTTATTTTTKPATDITLATRTTVLKESATNQSNLHVHEKESNSQGEEEPSLSLVWAILLILLPILLILGLAGFGGVYFFQLYRNVDQPSYQERCNVMYTSQYENL